MNADDLLAAVRDDTETELSRLGSSKSLYAYTGGDMDGPAVLAAAADLAHAAGETYADWVATEDHDAARDRFDAVATAEADRYEAIRDELDADYDPETVPAIQEYLRGLEDTAARAGGLLAATLVAKKLTEQLTGFFVGDADPQTASTFRGFGSDLDDRREAALELLDDVCEDDVDWDRAREAAVGAVAAAYDEYVEKLEAQGVNPKPVC